MKIFAAFVVASDGNKSFAATTRPGGGIGLPGGKLEPNETPEQAALREAHEEGWEVEGPTREIHRQLVDGKMVVWLRAEGEPKMLWDYKEKGRISPVYATEAEIRASGFGNENLPPGFI